MPQIDWLLETYPDIDFSKKIFILEKLPKKLDWLVLKAYSEKFDIVVRAKEFSTINDCIEHEIKFYWGFPITSYYELAAIAKNNPAYLYLGPPLCFQLDKMQKWNIPIRLCPNIANYYPEIDPDGLMGPWIRPEDVKFYEPYVDSFDFETDTEIREATLFTIYAIDKKWSDNLNILCTGLNRRMINSAMPDDFGQRRVTCGQRCLTEPGSCHHCLICLEACYITERKALEQRGRKLYQTIKN